MFLGNITLLALWAMVIPRHVHSHNFCFVSFHIQNMLILECFVDLTLFLFVFMNFSLVCVHFVRYFVFNSVIYMQKKFVATFKETHHLETYI